MKNQYAERTQLKLKKFDFNQVVDSYIHYATENTCMNHYRLLGIQVNQFNLQELLAFISERIQKKERTIISSQNLHSIYLFHRNKFLKAMQRVSVKRIDGMSIVYCGKLLGYPLKRNNRITWVDLIRPLMQKAANESWKVFYLGNDEATVNKGIKVLKTDYNDLNIIYENGFFNAKKDSADNNAIIAKINAYAPDVLIVGMGMPRQEKWILENKEALNATVIMTSGAAIEYIAGKVTTPPRWIGNIGFEWLFRLIENPKRFGFRYIVEPWFVLWLFMKDFGKKHLLRKDL